MYSGKVKLTGVPLAQGFAIIFRQFAYLCVYIGGATRHIKNTIKNRVKQREQPLRAQLCWCENEKVIVQETANNSLCCRRNLTPITFGTYAHVIWTFTENEQCWSNEVVKFFSCSRCISL